jgi:poly(3-hydroxybutyrate) depolymerase
MVGRTRGSSLGCDKTMSRPDPKKQPIGGTTRYYLLDVPTSADNKAPLMLIFALHGLRERACLLTGQ